MFVGKAIEQRSSYRVLGVLLFVQLGVSACAHAATLLMRSYARAAEESRASAAASSSGGTSADAEHISRQRRGERIVLLDVRARSPGLLVVSACFCCGCDLSGGEQSQFVRCPVQEDSQEVAEPDGSQKTAVDSGDVPAQRRCPLCLGVRVDPTSTPCGHVFCWECIAEWGSRTSGATDAECPLCRAAFTLQRLVPVWHAGF
jgi:peroxin-10